MSSSASPIPLLVIPPKHGTAELILHRPGEDIWNKLELPSNADGVYFVGSSHGWLFGRIREKDDVFIWNPYYGLLVNLPDLSSKFDISRVALSSASQDSLDLSVMIVYGPNGDLALWSWAKPVWTVVTSYVEDVVYSTQLGMWLSIPTSCLTELDDYYIWKRNGEELCAEEISIPSLVKFTKAACPNDDIHLSLKFDRVMYPDSELQWLQMYKASCFRFKYLMLYEESVFVVVRHVIPRRGFFCSIEPYLYISKYQGLDDSFYYQTVDFDVYEVMMSGEGDRVTFLEHRDAASLESLGLAMFVGANNSFAMPASKDPLLKPDCIYFSDEYRIMSRLGYFPDFPHVGHDNGIYNYKKGYNVSPLSPCCGWGASCPLNPLKYFGVPKIYPPPMWCISEGSISTEELGVVSKRPRKRKSLPNLISYE
ncbi:hypothetical protein OROGR_028771 [Orobanche gracilis]